MTAKEFNLSPYNKDNIPGSGSYQGYHRSPHQSHTHDKQSEKGEVTIQGRTKESTSYQSLALQTFPIIYNPKTFTLQKCLPTVVYLTLTFLRQVGSSIIS